MNGNTTMKATYTFVFVVSLLIWNVSSVENNRVTRKTGGTSSNNVETPWSDLLLVSSSNLRQQQKERTTNQLTLLQAYHQRNLHTLVRQAQRQQQQAVKQQQRHLQTTAPTTTPAQTTTTTPPPAPTICNATTGLVNFDDDDLNINLFSTPSNIYDSTCFCEEGTHYCSLVVFYHCGILFFAVHNHLIFYCVHH